MRRMGDLKLQRVARWSAISAAGLMVLGSLAGCVVVGYNSRGGWFVWPGGLGLVVLILFVVFLLRRR